MPPEELTYSFQGHGGKDLNIGMDPHDAKEQGRRELNPFAGGKMAEASELRLVLLGSGVVGDIMTFRFQFAVWSRDCYRVGEIGTR